MFSLVHTTASGTSSITQAPNHDLSKQVHKLLTIQVLNKDTRICSKEAEEAWNHHK